MMRQSLAWVMAACLALAAGGVARAQEGNAATSPGPCGREPVTIAQMQWPSGAVLAHIHAGIVERSFGCAAEVVPGDLSVTASSMANSGQPAVAPELWIARIADVWNPAVESQSVRQAGPTFTEQAMEGWFIPDFVAANHPDFTAARDLADYWQVFRPEGAEKARFISCPPDWACAVINRNMIDALGLSDRVEIVEPEDRFELDRLIGQAMSRREPILFYYWQPNAVLAQFSFRQLDLGAYDAEAAKCLATRGCEDPRPSAFASEPVVIALAERVFINAPQLAAYFQRARMPLEEMNALLAWQSEQGGTAESTAERFINTRSEIWRPWVQGE